MKKHFIIIFLTILIIILSIFISFFYFKNKLNETKEFNLIIYFSFLILCCFFPISFYTCWRLISDESYKGVFLYKHLIKPMSGFLAGVIFVPFVLAPLFVPDYISYFKYDLKIYKNPNYYE